MTLRRQVLGIRGRGVAVGVVVVLWLSGCAAAPSDADAEPSPTGSVARAPGGESAIPLGCADVLPVSAVSGLGSADDVPLEAAIDEDRIAVDLSVARLQLGALHCVWASRYGATDLHAQVELWIAPTAEIALDPAAELAMNGAWASIDGVPTALIACADSFHADDSAALYGSCQVREIRDGYRIELDVSAVRAATAGPDPTVALALLATIRAAVDGADDARVVEPVAGTAEPSSLCTAPEVVAVLAHLVVAGHPTVASSDAYPGVTTCRWDVDGDASDATVSVLPGGAWALPRLATGVSTFWIPTHPSSDGDFVVGVGDGVSAWRAIGDDLVLIESWDVGAREGWESFLGATW